MHGKMISTNILMLTFLLNTEFIGSLKLIELQVPTRLMLGAHAQLSCRWQLGSTDVLYSVKWYKDGKEFFRYVPKDQNPLRKFSLPGIEVAESDSFGANLTLASANLQTSGRYRCEVSGEKPFFPTVSKYGDLQIVVLPDHGPAISGLLPRYRVGDNLLVNCSSGRSRPPTDLTWYINGEPASTAHPLKYQEYEDGLTVTNSTLELKVTETYFRFKVKCLATLPPIYWKSVEETVINEKVTFTKKSEFRNLYSNLKLNNKKEKNSAYSMRVNVLLWSFSFLFVVICIS